MRKLFKKPVFWLFFCIFLSPFVIIGVLHAVNNISINNSINLNPEGIGNHEWFLFFGSFLGGICTLLAVLYTLSNNRKQSLYQAEIQEIQQENKILSDAIAQLYPFAVITYLTTIQNCLVTNYDVLKTAELITDIHNFGMKIDSNNHRVNIETDIMNKCYELCSCRDTCEFAFTEKKFTELYTYICSEEISILNEIIDFVDKTNLRELKYRDIKDDAEKSEYDKSHKKTVFENLQTLSNRIDKFKKIYPEIISQLSRLIKHYTAMNKLEAREHLRGGTLHNSRCLCMNYDKDTMMMMKASISKDIANIMQKEQS